MSFDPSYDQISSTTVADLKDDIVYDCFFVDTALQRKLRMSGALDEFAGGTVMQTPFQYNRVNGGAQAPGADITISQVQILAATAFQPKEYVEQIPLNLFQTNVINNGPAAKVKIVDAYMQNAVQALNTDLAIDFYRHGQPQASGYINSNRQYAINGASEALNDGVTNSWDGNVFVTYGGQARNGAITSTLNSVPIFVGNQNGSTGPITYKAMDEAYWNGVQEPDIGVTNKAAFSYIQERIAPQQRFRQELDATIGMSGLKVNNAYIFVDKLCPSTKFGSLLPQLSQTTAVAPVPFTSSANPNSISNLPASTTITPGEVFFWFRASGWKVRPAVDDEYNFNFTPPIRSQNNADLIVMFLKVAINFYTTSPRDNTQLYGIGA